MDVERAVVRTSHSQAARNMRKDDQGIFLEELLRGYRDLSPCEELFGVPDFAVGFEDKSAARDRPNCSPEGGDQWNAGTAFQSDGVGLFPFDAAASAARGKNAVSAGRAERLVMDRRDTVESTSTAVPARKRKALHLCDLEPERDSQDEFLVKQEGPYFVDYRPLDVFGGESDALIGEEQWREPTFADSCFVALSSSVRADCFGTAVPSAYQDFSIDGVGIPPTSSNDNSWGAGVPDVTFSDVKTSPTPLFETIDTGSFERSKLTATDFSTFDEPCEPWIPVHPRRTEASPLCGVGSNSSLTTPLLPENTVTPPFCTASPGKEAPVDDDNEETEEDPEYQVGEEESKSSSTGAEDQQSRGGEQESLVPRRRSRRRVHPTAKFRGEEVCWTPDDKDETEDDELGESPRKGSRSNRSRGGNRGKHARRSRWDGAEGSRRRKPHNPWTIEETRALVRGVEICGGGKWADIKRLGLKEIGSRTPVDLKDKWRNLLRVALLPPEQMRLKKIDRRQDLPMDLLRRVKELAQNKTSKRTPSTNLVHCKMAKISH